MIVVIIKHKHRFVVNSKKSRKNDQGYITWRYNDAIKAGFGLEYKEIPRALGLIPDETG
jgi:hypothetical protein